MKAKLMDLKNKIMKWFSHMTALRWSIVILVSAVLIGVVTYNVPNNPVKPFINKQRSKMQLSDLEFDEVVEYQDNYFVVKDKEYYGVVSSAGNIVEPVKQESYIKILNDGYYIIQMGTTSEVRYKGKAVKPTQVEEDVTFYQVPGGKYTAIVNEHPAAFTYKRLEDDNYKDYVYISCQNCYEDSIMTPKRRAIAFIYNSKTGLILENNLDNVQHLYTGISEDATTSISDFNKNYYVVIEQTADSNYYIGEKTGILYSVANNKPVLGGVKVRTDAYLENGLTPAGAASNGIFISSSNYIVVMKDNKYGLMNLNDKMQLNFYYQDLYHLKIGSYLLAKLNNKTGLIDINGKIKIPFEYDKIDFSKNYIVGMKNEKFYIYDKNFNMISNGVYSTNTNMERHESWASSECSKSLYDCFDGYEEIFYTSVAGSYTIINYNADLSEIADFMYSKALIIKDNKIIPFHQAVYSYKNIFSEDADLSIDDSSYFTDQNKISDTEIKVDVYQNMSLVKSFNIKMEATSYLHYLYDLGGNRIQAVFFKTDSENEYSDVESGGAILNMNSGLVEYAKYDNDFIYQKNLYEDPNYQDVEGDSSAEPIGTYLNGNYYYQKLGTDESPQIAITDGKEEEFATYNGSEVKYLGDKYFTILNAGKWRIYRLI